MDDEFGVDDAFLEAMAATDPDQPSRTPIRQPAPQTKKVQQPTPQRLDKAPPQAATSSSESSKVVQPKPQSLPPRQAGSTILVSPRQRGNPVLASLRSVPWEYSDIPADYVMGLSNCALFLSLKYHRLHPEYIYTRIRNLQGRYNLRIVLTMVDIPNHEDSLRELSKTSLVNNVTLILCWSAAEAARYLELYKSYENAGFAAIRGQQASSYADKLVDFVTVPRSLNKSDAVALVANFGSLRSAVNAEQEQLAMIGGWGGTKVKRWLNAVDEPFRARKAAKRGAQKATAGSSSRLDDAVPLSRVPARNMPPARSQSRQGASSGKQFQLMGDVDDDEETMLAAAIEESKRTSQPGGESSRPQDPPRRDQNSQDTSQGRSEEALSDGIAAALAKLRENGG